MLNLCPRMLQETPDLYLEDPSSEDLQVGSGGRRIWKGRNQMVRSISKLPKSQRQPLIRRVRLGNFQGLSQYLSNAVDFASVVEDHSNAESVGKLRTRPLIRLLQ